MKKENIMIKGIHCRSCEMLIKDELADLGVKDCRIDPKSGKAAIAFDESKLSMAVIRNAIKNMGYEII